MKSSPPAETYRPGSAVADLKTKFARLNSYVMSRGGWIVSIPGSPEVMIEVLPNSTLPDELRVAGYDLDPAGEGERILPAAIITEMTLSSSGAFEAVAPGSTAPVATRVHHAGITR